MSIINVIDLVQKTFASVLVRPIFHETNPNDGNFAVTMIETTGHGKFRFDMLWYGEYNGVPRPPAHRAITL